MMSYETGSNNPVTNLDLFPEENGNTLTLKKWRMTQDSLFEEIDENKDQKLDQSDLKNLDIKDATAWSGNEVEYLLSYWGPDQDKHFKNIQNQLKRNQDNELEPKITTKAWTSINSAINALGLHKAVGKKDNIYVESKSEMSMVAISQEGLTADGRRWFNAKVPFVLKIHGSSNTTEYKLIAHIIAVRHFPTHPDASRYAVVDFAIENAE